jgi:hypothetical protein
MECVAVAFLRGTPVLTKSIIDSSLQLNVVRREGAGYSYIGDPVIPRPTIRAPSQGGLGWVDA